MNRDNALGIYTIRNTLFYNDRYHSNVFSYFPSFSEAESSRVETVNWSPSTKAKFAAVLTLDYVSEEESDPKHPQRKRTVIPLAWESHKLHVLKR